MTKTEQQQAAIEVLSNRQSVAEWLNEWQPTHEEFEALVARLTSVYEDFHNEKKKADIENLLQLMKAKGISPQDLIPNTSPKPKQKSESEKLKIMYVTKTGEVQTTLIGAKGRVADAEVSEFLSYAKDIGLSRSQIAAMSDEEWTTKFTEYMKKMKK